MDNPYGLGLSKYSTHKLVLQRIGRNKVVLDVGCNDGYIGTNSDKSNVFYGLDYLESAIQKTKKVYKDATVYDLNQERKLPWQIKFDVIILADVLEHVLAPEKTLKFFVDNYLAKDGTVIVSLPNVANWQIRLRVLLGQFNPTETGIMDKTHLHFYTYKTALELVTSTSLRVTKQLGGASLLGLVIHYLPIFKNLFATSIIVLAKKQSRRSEHEKD